MIKIIDDSGDYFIHRSFDNHKPINLKYRFNKFELLTLFSFDNYDQNEEQTEYNKYHYKNEIGVTTTNNLHLKVLPLVKDLLIQIINSSYLIKDNKYKREVRKILYDEIKHINLLLSVNIEYKVYDKIHYFTQYPFYYILFDLINGNEIEIEFNYKVLELILNLTKKITSGCKQFNGLENLTNDFWDSYKISKPVFRYYCDKKEWKINLELTSSEDI